MRLYPVRRFGGSRGQTDASMHLECLCPDSLDIVLLSNRTGRASCSTSLPLSRGRRVGSAPLFQPVRFQRALKSFQAIWKAIDVFPVPVASVRSTRFPPPVIDSSTRLTEIS